MTNEQAILLLEAYKSNLTSSCSNQLDGDIEAFDMAIKSLQNERPKGKWVKSKDGYFRCDQCGSRGSAIKARFCHHCGTEMHIGGTK